MISDEGITRDESAVNSDNTEGIIEAKEAGTQTEERRLMQLGTRGLAIISMKVMLVSLLVLALLPRASAFTELLQQLEQRARQAMEEIATGITTGISNASKNAYRSITGACNAIFSNSTLIMITSLFYLSYCFNPFKA